MTTDDTRPLSAADEARLRAGWWDTSPDEFVPRLIATLDAERARHAALVAAARAVVDTAVVGGGWLLDDDLYPALDALEAVLASEEARNGNG